MSFKDLGAKVAAILNAKAAEPLKKEPAIKAPNTVAKPGSPGPKKT